MSSGIERHHSSVFGELRIDVEDDAAKREQTVLHHLPDPELGETRVHDGRL